MLFRKAGTRPCVDGGGLEDSEGYLIVGTCKEDSNRSLSRHEHLAADVTKNRGQVQG